LPNEKEGFYYWLPGFGVVYRGSESNLHDPFLDELADILNAEKQLTKASGEARPPLRLGHDVTGQEKRDPATDGFHCNLITLDFFNDQ